MFSNLSFFRKKTIGKIISVVLVHTFLFYSIGYAIPSSKVTMHQKKDTLAPHIISQLISNPEAFERLKKSIERRKDKDSSDAERLEKRLEAIKLAWAHVYLVPDFMKIKRSLEEVSAPLTKDIYRKMFFDGVELGVQKLNKQLPEKQQWLVEDIKKIAEAEIEKLFNEGAGTPGVHSGVGAVLDPAQVDIFDAILEESFKRDRAHKIKRDEGDNEKYYKYEDKKGTVKLREGFLFVKHDGLLEALDAKGLPHNIHPGRGGDVNGHKALMCHVDSFVFESLTLKELVTIGRHELAHLDIFNVEEMTEAERDEIKGTESYETWRTWVKAGKPAGDGQEAFVNSLEECNTSAIAQRIETIIKETRRRKVFEDEALNSVIYSLISKAEEEREKHGDSDIWKWVDMGNNRAFDVFDDDALDRAIIEYNWNADNPVVAPLGMTVHYGTRGTKRAYFESKRDASKLEIHCYVRRSVIEALSDKEKEVLLNNARMHILVSLGEVEVPQGMKEDEYVNLQAGCNITSFWKTIEQARRQGLLRSATRLVDEGIEQGDSKSVALGLATGVEARISMDDKDMLPDILMNIYQKYERETDIERKRILPIYKEAFDKLNARYPLVAKDWLKEALQSGQLSKRASKFINRLLREWLKPKDISGEEVNAVIMAGGGGTRLFPLSTDEEPKQLLSLIGERPLVVITIERLMQSGIPLGNIYIQTVPDLKDKILELVRKFGYDMKKEQIFAEPKGADTAAAIGYASAKLIERGKGDMPAFICTADHIIGDVKRSFRACYLEAAAIVKSSPLVATLGIRPQGPSSEYGHIMVDEELLIKGIYRVGSFKEKPKEDVAAKLWGTSKKILAEGKYTGACLFNSGMFIATPKTFFLAFRELSPRYHEGLERIVKAKGSAKEDVEREVFDEFAMWKAQKTFPDAKRIPEGTSVDYALAEPLGADQTDDVGLIVKPGEFPWTDIGSYKAVFEHYGQHMEEKFDGYGNLALKPRGADNVDVKLDKTSTDCLVIIGDMWPEEEDIKIKLDLRGLKNAMVIYNAKTRATMVAPMNLSGSSIKMIRAKIGEKGPRWAHFLKGSKPADTERKAIYRSTQDHTRLFSADFGRVLQVTLENEMHADIYSDYGLVVLSEVRDARVVQHKSEDGINICVGVGNKKDDFWKLAEELRERKVEQVKSLGAEFSEERVRDFLDEGRIADATIQRYARMYALDPDINSEVVISELVKIFIALAIKEEDIEKREAFIKQQKGEDMLSPYFLERVLAEFNESSTDPRTRTALLQCSEFIEKYGDTDVMGVVEETKKHILSGELGPVKSPEEVKAEIGKMREEYKPVKIGTSGFRGKAPDADSDKPKLTDMESYTDMGGYLEYLFSLGTGKGGIAKGDTMYIGGDLRSSTDRVMKAVAKAIKDKGCKVENLGLLPTPALANYALANGKACIMITASHNPEEDQGIKCYKTNGEVLKSDEPGMLACIEEEREKEFERLVYGESLFDENGTFRTEPEPLPDAIEEAKTAYIQRYVDAFGEDALKGEKVVLWQHSAVGRDMVKEIFEGLGAKVEVAGRSKKFTAVDTENVTDETRKHLKAMAKKKAFAIISTDGDSDRPLLADEKGEFITGDKLGALAAFFLKPTFAAVPISANDAAINSLGLKNVVRTKIGSPYVIKAMNDELKNDELRRESGDPAARIVSWEPNGGFLTGTDWDINGRALKALPTRDAVLPLISALLLAKQKDMSVSELVESQLPKWFTHADLIDGFPRDVGGQIVDNIKPRDENIEQIEKTESGIKITYKDGNSEEFSSESGPANEMFGIMNRLNEKYFTEKLGFRKIKAINFLDGVKITFDKDKDDDNDNYEVAHLRPSGNADQFRCYAQSDDEGKAKDLVCKVLDRIVPKMRDDVESDSPRKKARKAGASKTKGPVAGRRTPGVYSATAKGESGEGMQQDEKLILETGEILRRCHLFTGNLLQVMEEQPDKPFILAFDTDLGSRQKAQFMPIHKVIDEIEKWKEKKDEKGKLMFPQLKNLEVVRASGTNTGPRGLLQRIEEMRAGKPETNIVVVTKQDNIENFDSLKGVAWIAGIYDDTTDNPYYYLPVFEAATMAIMAALDAGNIQGIKKLWDEISEEEISEDALVKMMEDRIFYVLPKMRPVRPDILRKTYEKVLEVYQAA